LTSLGSVSLANNPYITEVKATGMGSRTSTITFPNGGILQRVELPKTLTRLDLRGHNQLAILTMEDNNYDNISSLRIEDCKLINTKALFTSITASRSLDNITELEIYLPDINWTIDYTDVVLDQENMIQSIPILDKLIRASGPAQSSENEDH